jgi:hypothetical protein
MDNFAGNLPNALKIGQLSHCWIFAHSIIRFVYMYVEYGAIITGVPYPALVPICPRV